ncbi:unnamed protein product [Effrenium voratum]|uniref:Uncharacterized protein n=1 Tax=Effrenium voratum TaxID=2562239 RepID=A0AA36IT75_9DINO|nr:unnamed protein product [Effrenium voratum]CAJ1383101.1 unnamed protein product [Effrenium voratum]CAJ1387437.1 unnamed protein product [Effrenium voratum]CAJ1393049.1 unnamed protein product [Effrenium voratum]CAJ1451459.1 unnamed protein product [Effrenium voratum]
MDIAIHEVTQAAAEVLSSKVADHEAHLCASELVRFILDHEHSMYQEQARSTKGEDCQELRVQVDGCWVKVEGEMPKGADPSTLVDLMKVKGTERPLHYAKTSLHGILAALPLILEGKSDYRASHAVHVQWLKDNSHRQEAEVTAEFADLPREEMYKDLAMSNSVRLKLLEFPCLAQHETLAGGGYLTAEDVELGAYPPAWDDVIELILDLQPLPATYESVRAVVREIRMGQ